MPGENGDRRDGGRDPSVTFRVGHEELVVRRRYEAASIVNDLLIGCWFTVGSILFLLDVTMVGSWLFLIGSVELLIRPVIRLGRNLYVTRVSGSSRGVLMGPSHDF